MASYKKGLRTISLRLHEQFVHAEQDQLNELVLWIRNPKNKPTFIKDFVNQIPDRRPSARVYTRPIGVVFDLESYMKNVVVKYFNGHSFNDITISWGRKSPRKRVKSRKLGSFRHDTKQVIIHPILDDRRVPDYVLEFMIYHELLHSLQPNDIKRPHNREFREKEKRFNEYSEVVKWQEKSDWIMH